MKTHPTLHIKGTNLHLPADDKNLVNVTERYGETHTIEAVLGTTGELEDLEDNQSVCWGDGKSYHFLLTKK